MCQTINNENNEKKKDSSAIGGPREVRTSPTMLRGSNTRDNGQQNISEKYRFNGEHNIFRGQKKFGGAKGLYKEHNSYSERKKFGGTMCQLKTWFSITFFNYLNYYGR